MWGRGSGFPGQPFPRELSVRGCRQGPALWGWSLRGESGCAGESSRPGRPVLSPAAGLAGGGGCATGKRPPVLARGSSGKAASGVPVAHGPLLVKAARPALSRPAVAQKTEVSDEHSARRECRIKEESFFCRRLAGFVSQGLVRVCLVRRGNPRAQFILFLPLLSLLGYVLLLCIPKPWQMFRRR